jgi:uncharacterized membrane protein
MDISTPSRATCYSRSLWTGVDQVVPAVVLLASFARLRLAGFLGIAALDNWNLPLRIALFLMFLLTASAHWGRGRPDLIRMVPSVFPFPATIITITGVLEILGAVGLLLPLTARAAAICLAILLAAMFPANIRAAREDLTIMGRPATALPLRTLLQLMFIGALLAVAA